MTKLHHGSSTSSDWHNTLSDQGKVEIYMQLHLLTTTLTKIVPILYIFYIQFLNYFFPFFCVCIFSLFFPTIKTYYFETLNSKKIVWLASHIYCNDSFKTEKCVCDLMIKQDQSSINETLAIKENRHKTDKIEKKYTKSREKQDKKPIKQV